MCEVGKLASSGNKLVTKGRRRKIGKLSRLVPGLEGRRFSHVEGGRLPLNTPGQVIKSLSYGVEEMMFFPMVLVLYFITP